MNSKKNKEKRRAISAKEMFALDFKRVNLALQAVPMLHVSSEGFVEAERCKDIKEYTPTSIILNMGRINAQINGDDLLLQTLTKQKIRIKGKIFSVVFLYNDGGELSENI